MEGFHWVEAEVQEAEVVAVPLEEAEEVADGAAALVEDFHLVAVEGYLEEAAAVLLEATVEVL